MTGGVELVRWAARVAPGKIRRLCESYARGIVDDDLLDDVALGLYARCQSILTVKAAKEGRVTCPGCGSVIARPRDRRNREIRCARCGWQTTWFAYRKTFLRGQLNHGGAADVFERYVRELPSTRTPHEKMRLIDWLLHECHKMVDHATGERFPARPIGPNLIQATLTEVMALLDELAYGPAGTDEKRAAQEQWRENVRAGRERMMEQVRGRQRTR
jgi:hypothetical protein